MRERGNRLWLVLILIMGILLGGCSKQTDKDTNTSKVENQTEVSPSFKKAIRIGASVASEDSAYLKSVCKYMTEEASNQGVELIVNYADWDAEVQTKQMEEFIQQKVDAIILCPVNAKSMLNPLKKAHKEGIPVLNLNMKVDSVSSEYIATYIGASSSEEAALAAELMVEAMPNGGKIAIIEGGPGSDAQIYRTQTFVEQMNAHPQFELVGVRNGNWNRGKAKLVAWDLMSKNPEVRGIFCHDSNMALGAFETLQELGLEEDVILLGVGEDEEYLEAIKAGKIYGLVTQPPEYEGKMSIICAVSAAKGEELRPWYKDPIEIVTKENVKN